MYRKSQSQQLGLGEALMKAFPLPRCPVLLYAVYESLTTEKDADFRKSFINCVVCAGVE